jgi:protocatechuate 3,4-dioxygenase beta subunit
MAFERVTKRRGCRRSSAGARIAELWRVPLPPDTVDGRSVSALNRRRFIEQLGSASLGALFFSAPGAFAEELTRTPQQTEGPFYPDHLPLDTDNDLIVVNDALTPAVGQITHLSGRILDAKGDPMRNVFVEIWQVDNNGAYLHSESANRERRDKNFQGFGRFLTGSTGEYYFRTIKPVAYPGRTPHIHFAIKIKGREKWTTQCYVRGQAGNERDGIWRSIRDPKARDAVTVDFVPIGRSRIGELAARFDIVLGFTPEA